jgi:O-antigen/teichoic acid export membrane protein
MSLHSQAARGLKWQAIEIGGRQLLSLLVFSALSRLVTPADFGLIGLVGVYLLFVSLFVQQGIGMAIVQRRDVEPGHLDAAFWFGMAGASLLCLATMALAEPVSRIFGEPRLPSLLRWASLVLVVDASAAIHGTLFMRNMDFRRPAFRTFLANGIGGLVGVTIAFAGGGVWALIGQQLGASAASAAFYWSASPWRPCWHFQWRYLKDLLRLGSAVFVSDILWSVSNRMDQLIIGRFLGAAALGQYVVGNKAADLAKTALYQPLGAVAIPALSRLQHDPPRLLAAIYRGMEINALIALPCLLGLSVVAPDLVPTLFGSQWQPAGRILQLIALYVLVTGLNSLFYPALIASGTSRGILLINGASALGTLAACLIGIGYGSGGVVLALIANAVLMTVPTLYFLRRRIGLSPLAYYRPCVRPALGAGLMCVAVLGLRRAMPEDTSHWLRLLLQIALGAVTYAGAMYLVGRDSLQRLLSMVAAAVNRPSGSEKPTEEVLPVP